MASEVINRIEATGKALNQILKDKGLQSIQKYCGKLWTDYNVHDPGITILETLCYTLTELVYKAQNSVPDILADVGPYNQRNDLMFAPDLILSGHPLTLLDFRKLILDIDEVKNAEVYALTERKDFKGLFRVDVELFYEDYHDDVKRNLVYQKIKNQINNNRNLCELIDEVRVLEYEWVAFDIDVEIDRNFSKETVLKNIYRAIEKYISPDILFHSLQELLDKGYTPKQIFDGPLLESGFLLDEQIINDSIHTEIHTSDLIKHLLEIEGVNYIKSITIVDQDGGRHKWRYKPDARFVLHLDVNKTNIKLFDLAGPVLYTKKPDADDVFSGKYQTSSSFKKKKFDPISGEYLELAEYFSFQNDMPQTYGVGVLGVPPHSSPKRAGLAKQLKAYLMLFDQVFQNYFLQLDALKKLYSLEDINRTYFAQPVLNIPGIEYMYFPFVQNCISQNVDLSDLGKIRRLWTKFKQTETESLSKAIADIFEDDTTFTERRNRVLDHILARFAFSVNQYSSTYSNYTNSPESIQHKRKLIAEYPEISRNRYKGNEEVKVGSIFEQSLSTGFENRISTILSIGNDHRFFIRPSDLLLQIFDFAEIEDVGGSSAIELALTAKNKNDAVCQLFKFGDEENNYRIDAGRGSFRIELQSDKNVKIGEFTNDVDSIDACRERISTIADRVNELNRASELFCCIEHILLKPLKTSNCFGFYLKFEDIVFFQSDFYTFFLRDTIVHKLYKLAGDISNYKVVNVGRNQYKMCLYDTNINFELLGHLFYSSEEDAFSACEKLAWYYASISAEEFVLNVEYTTSFQHELPISFDPFSYVMTVLLPEWPKRFQDEVRRQQIERTLISEAPAHIYLNIVWLKYDELEKIRKVIVNLIRTDKNDPLYDEYLLAYLNSVFL